MRPSSNSRATLQAQFAQRMGQGGAGGVRPPAGGGTSTGLARAVVALLAERSGQAVAQNPRVTVALPTLDDCLVWLEHFEAAYPEEQVYGKYGKGAGGHDTFAVIFHTESEARRDELLAFARAVCEKDFPDAAPVFSRGCGIPYEQLLGPWENWRKITKIEHTERIDEVKKKLRQSLFRA